MGRHEKRLSCGDEPDTDRRRPSPVLPAMIDEIRTGSRYFRGADENKSLIRK
jgi:hypothetical protein